MSTDTVARVFIVSFLGVASWFEESAEKAKDGILGSEWGTGGFKDIVFIVLVLAFIVERAPVWIRGLRSALHNGKNGHAKPHKHDTQAVRTELLIERVDRLTAALEAELADRKQERENERLLERARQGFGTTRGGGGDAGED